MPRLNDELDAFDSFNGLNEDDSPPASGRTVDMDEGDDVHVDVVDDTPPQDRKKPLQRVVEDPTDEELQNYGQRARARIGELTHARHDERRRADALQRERDEAVRVSQSLLQRTAQYEDIIKNGSEQFKSVSTEAAEAALAAAKAKLRKAKDDFDTDAEIDALAELQTAQARVLEAKNFKAPSSQNVEDAVQTRQTASVPAQDPKLSSWMRQNKWFNDPEHVEVTSYALGLHKKLVDSGYDPRSDEYYEQIDARVKQRFPEVVGDNSEDDRDLRRSSVPPRKSVVAPASRTTATKRITLTASQVAIAKSLGLTPQQYAVALIKENQNG